MNILIKMFSKIGKDKLMHFFCGFFITLIALLLLPKIIAALAVVLIAISKEVYDKITGGGVEVLDVVFTCLPLLMLFIVN